MVPLATWVTWIVNFFMAKEAVSEPSAVTGSNWKVWPDVELTGMDLPFAVMFVM
jgi:hypothetical protein